MKKYSHFIVALIWCIYAVYDYYYGHFFIAAIVWVATIAILSLVTFVQFCKLIAEWKLYFKQRIFILFFYLLFTILVVKNHVTHEIIEQIDTFVFLYQKKEIVEKIKQGEITKDLKSHSVYTQLPSGYPQVSNPNNKIIISRNEVDNTLTVYFYIFSNFMEAPSIILFYTNDPDMIKSLEEDIVAHPEQNWKVEENWYRFYGEDF